MIVSMKTTFGLVLALAGLSALSVFAEPNASSKQLEIYPKNLARHHLGASLLVSDEATKSFIATEAAAAWLDDDVSTGWPPLPGHHFYLLSLPEPQMLSNFCISARAPSGTVSLYAGDELVKPDAKSWVPLTKNLPLDSINDKRLSRPFNRLAKYLLIETNITDSGPWYGVYAYGDKPAVSYQLQKRAQPVDMHTILGPYVNPQVDFNLAALSSNGRVIQANATEGYLSWQKVIDDNPESGLTITPSGNESGLVIKYDQSRMIQRAAVLADPNTRGKLDIFLLKNAPITAGGDDAQFQKAALVGKNIPAAKSASDQILSKAISLENMTPATTIVFDGASPRGAINFAPTSAEALVVRWTPDTAGQPITIREINTFNDLSPSDYEVALTPEAIGEYGADRSKEGKAVIGEGKKEAPPLIGEQLPPKAPFLPGPPVFPNVPPLGPVSAP
jgi:hypothetical protein